MIPDSILLLGLTIESLTLIFLPGAKISLCPDCGWVGFLWGDDYSMGEAGVNWRILFTMFYSCLFRLGFLLIVHRSFPSGQFPSPAHL